MKKVYCVHKDKRALMLYNKKLAIMVAKKQGANVHSLSYGYYKDCHFVMDLPTFLAVSDEQVY
jgi:hypothetical protein